MKKLFNLINLFLAFIFLCGCTDTGIPVDEENANNPKMIAEIIAIGDKIEVEVIEGEYGASGIYWVNFNEKTPIVSKNGGALALADLSVGDQVKITYNGQVMMGYPPQIVARKIAKLA